MLPRDIAPDRNPTRRDAPKHRDGAGAGRRLLGLLRLCESFVTTHLDHGRVIPYGVRSAIAAENGARIWKGGA